MTNYRVSHSYLSQFLSDSGAEAGGHDMVGDYTSTPGSFSITPPEGQKYFINRMIVFIEDVGAFNSGLYGKDVVATHGVHLHVKRPSAGVAVYCVCGAEANVLTPHNVHTNSQWAQYCYDISLHSYGGGQVNGIQVVRWTFGKALPQGMDALEADMLTLHYGDELECVLNDDFSNLVGHRMIVQGVVVNER